MSPKQRLLAKLGTSVVALAVPCVLFFEGTVHTGYTDPIGIVTACTGNTSDAQLGRVYTPSECEELLAKDLLEHDEILTRCVKVPLQPHQRAALLSFAFNVGPGRAGQRDGFCVLRNGRTPRFLTRLNAGDYAGACAGLSDWTMAGGRVLQGLVKRRAAERAMCEGSGLVLPDSSKKGVPHG